MEFANVRRLDKVQNSAGSSGLPGPVAKRGPSRVLPDISVKRKETKTIEKTPTTVKKVTIRTDFPETWIWTDKILK